MNGKTPNGAKYSTIGQLRTYIEQVQAAVEKENLNLADAAQTLMNVANKPLSLATIEAVNKMLGLDEVVEAKAVWDEVEILQNAEPSPVPPAP